MLFCHAKNFLHAAIQINQALCVRVHRIFKNLIRRPCLQQMPQMEHPDPVRDILDH